MIYSRRWTTWECSDQKGRDDQREDADADLRLRYTFRGVSRTSDVARPI